MFQISSIILHLLNAVVQLRILLFHHSVNLNILLQVNYLQLFKNLFLLVLVYPDLFLNFVFFTF